MSDTVLRIDASPRRDASVSRKLGDDVVARLAPATTIVRDLSIPVPQIDEVWISAAFTAPDDRTDAQAGALAVSDALVAEVQAADTLVFTMPLYNFGVPAAVKAWIDQVARAGVTFRYTEYGPQGLLEDKRAVVVIATGGTTIGSEIDFASAYMRHVLAFIGIQDVQFVVSDPATRGAQDPDGIAAMIEKIAA